MIKSRYGGKTHIIVLVFGLFTNIIVTLSLLLGGTAVLTGLVQVTIIIMIITITITITINMKTKQLMTI